jgi:hypothetical protein
MKRKPQAANRRETMAHEEIASRAALAIAGRSELEKAIRIKATLQHVTSVVAAGIPSNAAKWVLQHGCRDRTSKLKQLTRSTDTAVETERRAAEAADKLLLLRMEEWCGGPVEAAPLEVLRQKCRQALQSPEALERQVALLSAERDATNLGLGELIARWPAEGLRYGGVAWAAEAAFYRSAAEKLMREHPVLAQHNGNSHEQVRKRFQHLDKEILELNRKMIAAKLHIATSKSSIPATCSIRLSALASHRSMLNWKWVLAFRIATRFFAQRLCFLGAQQQRV